MRKQEQDINLLSKMGYESQDVGLPTLARWFGYLVGFIAFSAVLSYIIYIVFLPSTNATGRASALALNAPETPSPRLQARPKWDMRLFREDEDKRIKGYTWRDEAKGIVSIPVDRAIDLVLKEGLPTRAAAPRVEFGNDMNAPMAGTPTTGREIPAGTPAPSPEMPRPDNAPVDETNPVPPTTNAPDPNKAEEAPSNVDGSSLRRTPPGPGNTVPPVASPTAPPMGRPVPPGPGAGRP
jgi:hypothetical protein